MEWKNYLVAIFHSPENSLHLVELGHLKQRLGLLQALLRRLEFLDHQVLLLEGLQHVRQIRAVVHRMAEMSREISRLGAD